MLHLAQKIEPRLGLDVASIPGGGTAGGLGAGLIAFARARFISGIDLILETVRFHERVRGADVVITGEGMVDGQTVYGKTPYGVLKAAQELDVPVVVIAGGLGADVHLLEDAGLPRWFIYAAPNKNTMRRLKTLRRTSNKQPSGLHVY